MIHHYITKYYENNVLYAEAWIQLNLFGKCFCFSKKRIEINNKEDGHSIYSVMVREEETGETFASIYASYEGSVKGIVTDGYEVLVNGAVLEKELPDKPAAM